MTDSLHSHISGKGSRLQLDASAPLAISDPSALWFVEEGRLDVFLVGEGDSREQSERVYCFSVEAGQAVFGVAPQEGRALLGVALPGTSVVHLRQPEFRALPREPRVALVEGHLGLFGRALSEGVENIPEAQVELEAGQGVLLDQFAVARPLGQTIWVRHKSGASLHMGIGEIENGDGWFPIRPELWIQALSDSELECCATSDILGRDDIVERLGVFHRNALSGLSFGAAFASADRLAALREKTASDIRITRDGLMQLASVMDSRTLPLGTDMAETALAAACMMVGNHLGVDFSGLESPPSGKTVEEVAESANMRARRVLLRGNWFEQDGGPMVGFMAEGKRPVALIPASPRSYMLHDPGTGETVRFKADMLEELEPAAYTLYRPLPDRKLRLRDIPLFGLRGCWKDLAWVLGLGCVLGLLGLVTPMLTRTIFNDIIPGAERGRLLQIVAILFGFTVVSLLFEVTKSIAMVRVKARADHTLETALWERLMRMPANFFRRFTAGDLANRAMALNSVQQLLSGASLSSMFSGFFSLIYLGLLFYYDAKLALVSLMIILVSALATAVVSFFQIRYQRKAVKLGGRLSGLTLQFITGVAKLRAGGAEDRALTLWARDFSEQRRISFRSSQLGNAFSAFNTAFATVGSALIFTGVVYFERETPMDMGTFMAFWAAFGSLQGAVLSLVGSATNVFKAVPYFERLKPIMEEQPEDSETLNDPGDIKGNIELSHVSFRYDDEGPLVLDDVSFKIRPGEFVAITGSSGSGKTTLLRLLLGFETPRSGSILYENQDLSQLDVAKVRKQMGVVLQNGGLMPGDIFTNIIGASTLTIDDAWEAARMAGFEEDIKAMPMGMHTVISEGAGTLSGGQRQRLIIARALARKPSVLLFDEATSALDNRTQEIVTQSLNQLDVTRIVIAHRLSTIRDADRIIVLEDGRIREQGNYQELMAEQGLFHSLVKRQMA